MNIAHIRKSLFAAFLVSFVLLVSGCGNVYSRDDFKAGVIGKSEQEITQQFGQPDSVESSDPGQIRWIYKHKTFDLANENKMDSRTVVIFHRAVPDGKAQATDVQFS